MLQEEKLPVGNARQAGAEAALKAQGKEKTATYRQLFARKLTLGELLTWYKPYGLAG